MGVISAAVERNRNVREKREVRAQDIEAIKQTGHLTNVYDRQQPSLPRLAWLDNCDKFNREYEEKYGREDGNLQRRPNRRKRGPRQAEGISRQDS